MPGAYVRYLPLTPHVTPRAIANTTRFRRLARDSPQSCRLLSFCCICLASVRTRAHAPFFLSFVAARAVRFEPSSPAFFTGVLGSRRSTQCPMRPRANLPNLAFFPPRWSRRDSKVITGCLNVESEKSQRATSWNLTVLSMKHFQMPCFE
jgi:hypothetical protein